MVDHREAAILVCRVSPTPTSGDCGGCSSEGNRAEQYRGVLGPSPSFHATTSERDASLVGSGAVLSYRAWRDVRTRHGSNRRKSSCLTAFLQLGDAGSGW